MHTTFQEQFNALLKQYNQTKNAALADGIIDYGESLVIRDFLTHFGWELERLKIELVNSITDLRETYRNKLQTARRQSDSAEAMLRLRHEYRTAFESIEKLVEQVDYWLVQVPEERRSILELIARHEARAEDVFAGFEPVTFDDKALDTPPVKAELTRITHQWRNLLKNIDQRPTPVKPGQEAYDKGVRRAIELALADITRVIETLE